MTQQSADKEHAVRVGKTIHEQLRYDGPFGTLGRIAARDFCIMPIQDNSQGGLRFRCSIRKKQTKHWIEITLEWSDTYRVRLLRKKRGPSPVETVLDTDESGIQVYCDELKDTVETFAEAHV